MEIYEIIQIILTSIFSGGIVLVLIKQIKSQKEQVDIMKTTVESLETFTKLISLDEVQERVDLAKINTEEITEIKKDLEWREKLKQLASSEYAAKRTLQKERIKAMESELEIRYKHQELLGVLLQLILMLPKDNQKTFIESNLVHNKNELLEEIEVKKEE
ncbi:MAG: hypothetical protein AAF847_00185 [Bacteroidota bacterium]